MRPLWPNPSETEQDPIHTQVGSLTFFSKTLKHHPLLQNHGSFFGGWQWTNYKPPWACVRQLLKQLVFAWDVRLSASALVTTWQSTCKQKGALQCKTFGHPNKMTWKTSQTTLVAQKIAKLIDQPYKMLLNIRQLNEWSAAKWTHPVLPASNVVIPNWENDHLFRKQIAARNHKEFVNISLLHHCCLRWKMAKISWCTLRHGFHHPRVIESL